MISSFIRFVISSLFLLLIGSSTYASSLDVSASLDTNQALIGDQVDLTIQLRANEQQQFVWPVYGDTLIGGLEITDHGTVDTSYLEGGVQYKQTLTLTSFDSGFYAIPPFVFVEFTDTSNRLETEPLLLEIKTMQVDTSIAIRDIKKPMDVPITFEEIAPYVFGVIALIGLAFLIYYLFKRFRKKPKIVVEKKPEIPAHITAIKGLILLESKGLWQKNEVKVYHTELTGIIRFYLEERYGMIAMEQTTEEILAVYSSYTLEIDIVTKLRQLLILADMVKFAKAKPLPAEHILSMKNACDFVEATKLVESSKETIEKSNNG